MNVIHRRLAKLWRRLPWRKVAVICGAVLLASGAAYAYLGRTVTRDVEYGPCEIEHGELIGGWEGKGQDPWNEQGFYYEARRFSVAAETGQDFWFRNVAEREPTFISSAGDDSCLDGFSGKVEPTETRWRWEGARATDLRLGVPDLGSINQAGAFSTADKLRPDPAFSPPIFGTSGNRAAAMADDNARAVIRADNGDHQIWCFSAHQDSEDCSLTTGINDKKRSAGYLFAADNCPQVFREADVACARATDWYSQLELGDLVGTNSRGELKAFQIDLEAVSTFAPRVGAWMVAVFKYPSTTNITAEIAPSSVKLDPGERLEIELKLTKTGPDLTKLSVVTDLSGQPLSGGGINAELNANQLAELNDTGTTLLSTAHTVNAGATRSKCHEYALSLGADANRQVDTQSPRFSYCIKAARQIEYTYSIDVLGQVESGPNTFVQQVTETLNHRLGWGSVGITFTKVASSGDFVVYLASPDQVDAASTGCDATYSCQVGNAVYINDARWRNATPSWNDSGGSLREYRHMVVNHETGHWLGFGHPTCSGSGQLAPVMQQQSIDLAGCKHNPWPTKAELTILKNRLNL